jgi:hypothetical protein
LIKPLFGVFSPQGMGFSVTSHRGNGETVGKTPTSFAVPHNQLRPSWQTPPKQAVRQRTEPQQASERFPYSASELDLPNPGMRLSPTQKADRLSQSKRLYVNHPGFDAASFLVKDDGFYAQAIPERTT